MKWDIDVTHQLFDGGYTCFSGLFPAQVFDR
jgi:hypothetical protein